MASTSGSKRARGAFLTTFLLDPAHRCSQERGATSARLVVHLSWPRTQARSNTSCEDVWTVPFVPLAHSLAENCDTKHSFMSMMRRRSLRLSHRSTQLCDVRVCESSHRARVIVLQWAATLSFIQVTPPNRRMTDSPHFFQRRVSTST